MNKRRGYAVRALGRNDANVCTNLIQETQSKNLAQIFIYE